MHARSNRFPTRLRLRLQPLPDTDCDHLSSFPQAVSLPRRLPTQRFISVVVVDSTCPSYLTMYILYHSERFSIDVQRLATSSSVHLLRSRGSFRREIWEIWEIRWSRRNRRIEGKNEGDDLALWLLGTRRMTTRTVCFSPAGFFLLSFYIADELIFLVQKRAHQLVSFYALITLYVTSLGGSRSSLKIISL